MVTRLGRLRWTQTVLFISRARHFPRISQNWPFPPRRIPDKLSRWYTYAGDAFVAKFDNLGTNLIYITYLGGSGDDVAYGLAVDEAGNAYIAGYTDSTNFPQPRNPALYANISGTVNKGSGYYPA